jgi:hypothetical protein
MTGNKSQFPEDRTRNERRKDLSSEEIKDLELAGGVEGGMQAGSAGGPGEAEVERSSKDQPEQPRGSAASDRGETPDD